MKKSTFFTALVLAGLNVSCSTQNNTQDPPGAQVATVATAHPAQGMRHHQLPEGVISVDIVSDRGRLHLLTGKHVQGQKTLWHQLSDDGGEHWTTAVKILDAGSIAANMVRGNDAQIAAQGENIVVTWMSYVAGARFNAGPMQAARSGDSGATWQFAATPPDWKKGPHGYIDMTSDANALHAVWLDSRRGPSEVSAAQALHYARSVDGGLNWQQNLTLDDLTCSCCWNTVKSDKDGNVYVLYRDKQPSDMALGVVDRRQQWQRLSRVGAFDWQFDGCPHIGGGMDFQHTAGATTIHAVVGSGQEQHAGVHYLYSTDGGKTWSDPVPLGDESALHADLAAQDNGRIVAVWDMLGDDGLAVFAAESPSSDKKNWSSPLQLSKRGTRASHPRIVKTEQGFLALWTEHDGHRQTLAMRRF